MPDLLQTASEWLDGMRHQHATRQVVYERGAEQISVQATIGRTEFEEVDAHGVVIKTESRDFLIRAADLVLGGAATLPQRGDRVHEDTSIYEVLAPGNHPHWRYSDLYRQTLRIHTKHVGNA